MDDVEPLFEGYAALRVPEQHRRPTHDGVERRAQLVADGGEELVLDAVRLLGAPRGIVLTGEEEGVRDREGCAATELLGKGAIGLVVGSALVVDEGGNADRATVDDEGNLDHRRDPELAQGIVVFDVACPFREHGVGDVGDPDRLLVVDHAIGGAAITSAIGIAAREVEGALHLLGVAVVDGHALDLAFEHQVDGAPVRECGDDDAREIAQRLAEIERCREDLVASSATRALARRSASSARARSWACVT